MHKKTFVKFLISLFGRPIFLSLRALLAFYVVWNIENSEPVLITFAFVALSKSLIDRNKSIRMLGQTFDASLEFDRYLIDLLPGIIIALIGCTIWGLSLEYLLIAFLFTSFEVLFSFYTLVKQNEPLRIAKLGVLSLFLSTLIITLPSIKLELQLIGIGIINLSIGIYILRKFIKPFNFRDVWVEPDYYLIAQSLLAFSSKYIFGIFENNAYNLIVSLFLISEVYLFSFNIIYPTLRIFNQNKLRHHIPFIVLIVFLLLIQHNIYVVGFFFSSYLRMYYTAGSVNDKRNTSFLLILSIFDLISRLLILLLVKNMDVIIGLYICLILISAVTLKYGKNKSSENIYS